MTARMDPAAFDEFAIGLTAAMNDDAQSVNSVILGCDVYLSQVLLVAWVANVNQLTERAAYEGTTPAELLPVWLAELRARIT